MSEEWIEEIEDVSDEEVVENEETEAQEEVEVEPEVKDEASEAASKEVPRETEKDPVKGVLADLARERERRRELDEKLSQVEQQAQEREKKYDLILKKLEEAQQSPPPDPEEDPYGHLQHQVRQTQEQLESFSKQTEEQKEQARQRELADQEIQRTAKHITDDEQTFATHNPDYYQALEFLIQKEKQVFVELGLNEQQALQKVMTEKFNQAAKIQADGLSPAAFAYNQAKIAGYTASEASSGNKSQEDIERQKKALEASQGSSSGAKLTKDQIDAMGFDEFEQTMENFVKGLHF